MKYHFQFVSKTTVRIELIPENKKEIALIEKLSFSNEDHEQLTEWYQKGLEAYNHRLILTKTKFMNFPRVALCNHTLMVNNVA